MAAFPYPFHLDSALPPLKNLSSFIEQPNTNSISQFYLPELFLDQNSAAAISDNELSSATNKHSTASFEENKLQNGEQLNHSKRKKNNNSNKSNASSSTSLVKGEKEGRSKKLKKSDNEMKEENKTKNKEEPPTGYIHVRARRGQATDSHSLAERVRREKISERMKILEKLVPGCDKVTGKALMLDEIINYVQSLQNQVEFLSMKLATVNPLIYQFGMDIDPLTPRPDHELSDYISSFSPMQHEIQESGSLMWDVNEQMEKFVDQSGIINNTSCSSLH